MHGNCTPASSEKPALEIADIVRARLSGSRYFKWLTPARRKVANALVKCRTAALGGFMARCDQCRCIIVQYASCRNRHCPKCQSIKQTRWVELQQSRLLDIDHWHLVFTLPHVLNPIAQANARLIYSLLFKAAAQTLLEFGRDPKWLGGQIGATLVLHTWGQNLGQHIHVHAIVTGGALAKDTNRWVRPKYRFLFPVRALSQVFRGKYIHFLQQAYRKGELHLAGGAKEFESLQAELLKHNWVVYAKPPFKGVKHVIAYLGRYTNKIAISNHRLVNFDGRTVRFRWRDYADGNRQKIMQLDADEFVRRFMLHVLPLRFMRIRHYGLFSNRDRDKKLAQCRALLGQDEPQPVEPESAKDMVQRLTGVDVTQCPRCKQGTLVQFDILKRSYGSCIRARGPPSLTVLTS